MKKLLLTGIAALFLATGTVQAAPPWTEEELRSGTRKIEIYPPCAVRGYINSWNFILSDSKL